MSPIQQIFLGIGPSGDKYWWQKCDQSDSSGSGWYGNNVTVDDEENSYFTPYKGGSTYQRTYVLGFDKDGANIVKSYGGDWPNGEDVPSNKAFRVTDKGFVFANRVYLPGRPGNPNVNWSCGVDVIDVTSGQTPSQLQLQHYWKSGNSTELTPSFLVSRLGSGLTHSVDFDGTGDYLTQSGSSDFAFGTGDFTWEAWIKPSAWSTSGGITIPLFSVSGSGGFWVGNHSNKFRVLAYDGGVQLETSTFPIVKQWTHVAVTRSGTSLRLFYNGVLIQTATNSHSFASSTVVNIALDATNYNNHFTGNISNLRVVKGTAVYTANFAPSVEPLTNITNTKLLCCNGSSTTSSTVTPGTITANGNPTVAQDCPLSSSYLCGGSLKNTSLGSNKFVPFLYKSGVILYENANDTTDLFYAKRETPTGTYIFETRYSDAAITSDGLYAYLVGHVMSNSSGTMDAYITKVNYLTGALISRNFYGGVSSGYGTDYFNAIAIDSSGNIYCAGKCKSGYSDKAYIIKLNSSLAIQWEKGISNLNYILSLAVDSSGDVYALANSNVSGYKGGYVMKITSSGTLDWAIKLTLNGFTDRYPFLGNLDMKGENENLYFAFSYNKNPSSNSPTTTYRNLMAGIKYPRTGNITGTYGDLVFTSVTNLSTSDVTLPNDTNSLTYGDENTQELQIIERDAYSNGNPTLTKTNL
tara:strand:+ start:45 stop:2123 length:2079 start_codon:yes stop_codon:yes gene_type:complete